MRLAVPVLTVLLAVDALYVAWRLAPRTARGRWVWPALFLVPVVLPPWIWPAALGVFGFGMLHYLLEARPVMTAERRGRLAGFNYPCGTRRCWVAWPLGRVHCERENVRLRDARPLKRWDLSRSWATPDIKSAGLDEVPDDNHVALRLILRDGGQVFIFTHARATLLESLGQFGVDLRAERQRLPRSVLKS